MTKEQREQLKAAKARFKQLRQDEINLDATYPRGLRLAEFAAKVNAPSEKHVKRLGVKPLRVTRQEFWRIDGSSGSLKIRRRW
jgi:hypothetical protein